MLDWLTEAERHLRYQGPLAENEDALQKQLTEHEVSSFNLYIKLLIHSLFIASYICYLVLPIIG